MGQYRAIPLTKPWEFRKFGCSCATVISASTSLDQIALVCNTSKLALPLQAVAAWHAWRFGGEVHKMWHAGGLGTSDDVELLTMLQAAIWTGDLLPQLAEVHIYSDSLKAICWLFDTSNHLSMDCSLAVLWAI